MLQFLLLVPVLLGFSTACSREKEQGPAEQPKPESKPPTDIFYSREFLKDKSAPSDKKLAAFLDYVGAVYGEEGKVSYDGKLTAAERDYIESQFGKITRVEEFESLIARARTQFLNEHGKDRNDFLCKNPGKFEFRKISHSELGVGAIFGGPHTCGEAFGSYYFSSGLEMAIAADPLNWGFMIERSQLSEYVNQLKKKPPLQEVALFSRIAKVLNIPIQNPLLSVESPPVIQALEEKGFSKLDQAVSLAMAMTYHRINLDPKHDSKLALLPPEKQMSYIYEVMKAFIFERKGTDFDFEVYPKIYQLKEEDFYRACEKFLTPPQGEDPVLHFETQLRMDNDKFGTETIPVANQLSEPHLKSLLSKSGKKNHLFLMGTLHVPLVLKVYGRSE